MIKGIKFVKDFDSAVPSICADAGQLAQVLLDLMLSGIDAIAEEGEISDESIEIRISESGKGIDQMALEMVSIFVSKPKGTGPGLAVCKRLVEQA